jgi:tRNA threonylcarbamoyladenosine biosynthesis protein TsaB
LRILAFESSAKAASVALLQDDSLLGEFFTDCGRTHSKTLMKMAQELLACCELTAADITAVACASGPGSFTGVRIGTAAAKGFAWGRELPCCGVSTLYAMAQQARFFEGVVCCAMDARREEVYNALFLASGGSLSRLTEDRAISLASLREELKKIEMPKIVFGDGAQLCYNFMRNDVTACRLAPEHMRMQRASGVALVAREMLLSAAQCSADALVPNYLRLSQAERERAARMSKECDNG